MAKSKFRIGQALDHESVWDISAYDFDLPDGVIADRPVRPRDAARLLDVASRLTDRIMTDLPEILNPGDIAVFNDTRVIPARLVGQRGQARVEATLHMDEGCGVWRAFARPAKRLRPGDRIEFGSEFAAEVVAKGDGGEILIRFDGEDRRVSEQLNAHGVMPLPPYIRRDVDHRDRQDYQTVFADRDGAVAAPTAGLHFTDALLAALEKRGVRLAYVTLHVGAGTFLPVKVDDIRDHRIHEERGYVTEATARRINDARKSGGRIVAIGSTSLRLLESASDEDGRVHAFAHRTGIFIYPGYRFRTADLLLTNFHLPRSTLFMLVAAFAGLRRMRAAYAHAIERGYRFYSYGDACLLHRGAR